MIPPHASESAATRLAAQTMAQHGKQTSSQLLNFLRSKCASSETFRPPSRFSAGLLHNRRESGVNLLSNIVPAANGFPKQANFTLAATQPTFRLKQKCTAGCVSYSFVISNNTEVWDASDICTAHSGDTPQKPDIATKIPPFKFRKFEEINVTVSHVVDPNNFYIQHAGPDLQELSQKIALESSSDPPALGIPNVGDFAVGWCPTSNMWCRGQVVKICGMQEGAVKTNLSGFQDVEVEMRRIDYGDVVCVFLCNIKPMEDYVYALPEQALQVSLENVSPVDGVDWSEEAIDWFKDRVANRTLYARLYPQGNQVMVELFMEKGKIGAMRRSASLSARLVQHGYGVHKLGNAVLKIGSAQPQTSSKSEKTIVFHYKNKKSA